MNEHEELNTRARTTRCVCRPDRPDHTRNPKVLAQFTFAAAEAVGQSSDVGQGPWWAVRKACS